MAARFATTRSNQPTSSTATMILPAAAPGGRYEDEGFRLPSGSSARTSRPPVSRPGRGSTRRAEADPPATRAREESSRLTAEAAERHGRPNRPVRPDGRWSTAGLPIADIEDRTQAHHPRDAIESSDPVDGGRRDGRRRLRRDDRHGAGTNLVDAPENGALRLDVQSRRAKDRHGHDGGEQRDQPGYHAGRGCDSRRFGHERRPRAPHSW